MEASYRPAPEIARDYLNSTISEMLAKPIIADDDAIYLSVKHDGEGIDLEHLCAMVRNSVDSRHHIRYEIIKVRGYTTDIRVAIKG